MSSSFARVNKTIFNSITKIIYQRLMFVFNQLILNCSLQMKQMKMNELNVRFFFQYFQRSDSKAFEDDTQNDFLYFHELCRRCADVVRLLVRRVSDEAVVDNCGSDNLTNRFFTNQYIFLIFSSLSCSRESNS